MIALLWLNALLALASAAFGVVALLRPAALTSGLGIDDGAVDRPVVYYAQIYASRAVPLGIGVCVVCLMSASGAIGQSASAGWLFVAAGAQLGDVLIGVQHSVFGMIGAQVCCWWSTWSVPYCCGEGPN